MGRTQRSYVMANNSRQNTRFRWRDEKKLQALVPNINDDGSINAGVKIYKHVLTNSTMGSDKAIVLYSLDSTPITYILGLEYQNDLNKLVIVQYYVTNLGHASNQTCNAIIQYVFAAGAYKFYVITCNYDYNNSPSLQAIEVGTYFTDEVTAL